MIAFTVPGPPQGKARARTVYNPKLKRSISYTPDNTVLYENLIKTRYLEVTDKKYENKEALHVSITAFLNHRKVPRKRGGRSCLPGTKNLAKSQISTISQR